MVLYALPDNLLRSKLGRLISRHRSVGWRASTGGDQLVAEPATLDGLRGKRIEPAFLQICIFFKKEHKKFLCTVGSAKLGRFYRKTHLLLRH